jgi:hypothetical protein
LWPQSSPARLARPARRSAQPRLQAAPVWADTPMAKTEERPSRPAERTADQPTPANGNFKSRIANGTGPKEEEVARLWSPVPSPALRGLCVLNGAVRSHACQAGPVLAGTPMAKTEERLAPADQHMERTADLPTNPPISAGEGGRGGHFHGEAEAKRASAREASCRFVFGRAPPPLSKGILRKKHTSSGTNPPGVSLNRLELKKQMRYFFRANTFCVLQKNVLGIYLA